MVTRMKTHLEVNQCPDKNLAFCEYISIVLHVGAKQRCASLPEDSSQVGVESEELWSARLIPMDGSQEKHLH